MAAAANWGVGDNRFTSAYLRIVKQLPRAPRRPFSSFTRRGYPAGVPAPAGKLDQRQPQNRRNLKLNFRWLLSGPLGVGESWTGRLRTGSNLKITSKRERDTGKRGGVGGDAGNRGRNGSVGGAEVNLCSNSK